MLALLFSFPFFFHTLNTAWTTLQAGVGGHSLSSCPHEALIVMGRRTGHQVTVTA